MFERQFLELSANSTKSVHPCVLPIQLVAPYSTSWTLLGFQNVREGSSLGVMRQCLHFPAAFPLFMYNDVISPREFKLKYTIMPFNIDIQVHYCLHSVEGCSVLK